jgi:hypothetical protein
MVGKGDKNWNKWGDKWGIWDDFLGNGVRDGITILRTGCTQYDRFIKYKPYKVCTQYDGDEGETNSVLGFGLYTR